MRELLRLACGFEAEAEEAATKPDVDGLAHGSCQCQPQDAMRSRRIPDVKSGGAASVATRSMNPL